MNAKEARAKLEAKLTQTLSLQERFDPLIDEAIEDGESFVATDTCLDNTDFNKDAIRKYLKEQGFELVNLCRYGEKDDRDPNFHYHLHVEFSF